MNNKSLNKSIYNSRGVTETRVGQRDNGNWLRRIGMFDLVMMMDLLSGEYGFGWAEKWGDHLDDPKWLDRAMVNTFGRLRDADQELLRELYEDWCWYFANLDLEAAVKLGYVAEVALLDRDKRRVVDGGEVQTVLVSLDGASRGDAKRSLTSEYEFIRWC
jgi:hypothetical protein